MILILDFYLVWSCSLAPILCISGEYEIVFSKFQWKLFMPKFTLILAYSRVTPFWKMLFAVCMCVCVGVGVCVCIYIYIYIYVYIMTLSENVPYTLIWKSGIFMGLPYSQAAIIISPERQLWQLFYTVLTSSPSLALDTILFSSPTYFFSFFLPLSFFLSFSCPMPFFIHLPKWTQL